MFRQAGRFLWNAVLVALAAGAVMVGALVARPAWTPRWLDIASLVAMGVVAIGFLVLIAPLRDHTRFFTREQRSLASYAFGPNCIWRPASWPPVVAGYLMSSEAWAHQRPNLFIASQAVYLIAIPGLPIVRQAGRCGDTIQGGHERAAADEGTASIWNLVLECGVHNRAHSTMTPGMWSFHQWPWTPPVYFLRWARGKASLAWRLNIEADDRDREKAEPAPVPTPDRETPREYREFFDTV